MKKISVFLSLTIFLLIGWSAAVSQPIIECIFNEDESKFEKDYLFISYCHIDSEAISGLRQFLNSNDISYWDFIESECENPSQYEYENVAAIVSHSKVSIKIISKSYLRSPKCNDEIFMINNFKQYHNLTVIEVCIDDIISNGNCFAIEDDKLYRKISRYFD